MLSARYSPPGSALLGPHLFIALPLSFSRNDISSKRQPAARDLFLALPPIHSTLSLFLPSLFSPSLSLSFSLHRCRLGVFIYKQLLAFRVIKGAWYVSFHLAVSKIHWITRFVLRAMLMWLIEESIWCLTLIALVVDNIFCLPAESLIFKYFTSNFSS